MASTNSSMNNSHGVQKLNANQLQKRLTAILDNAGDGLITIDANGIIQVFNASCQRIFGYSQEEILGKNISVLVPKGHSSNHDGYLSKYLETNESIIVGTGREVEARCKDGRLIPIEICVTKVEIEEETLFTAVLRDISERKKAESDLKSAREMAMEASKAKTFFLANMSHEIRTPMNGIIGTAKVLQQTSLTDKQRKNVDIISQSGCTLLQIINDILDFSKIETGHLEIINSPFNFRQSIESTFSLLKPLIEEKGLNYTLEMTNDVPNYLVSDEVRVKQVLTNLVSNAIKFTKEGSIGIKVHKNDNHLKFIVSDSGIGIPLDCHNKVFQAFEQISEGRKASNSSGTGLGLSICKHLVESMGGNIGFKSTHGLGTSFWFTVLIQLPSNEETRLLTDEPKTLSFDKDLLPRDILVVEDIEMNQFIISEILEDLNCNVDVANNGLECIGMLKNRVYDLVLMDCNMPVMDGFTATQKLRELGFKSLPIVALTANAMKGDRELCINHGMDDFLSKPVTPESVLNILVKYQKPSS